MTDYAPPNRYDPALRRQRAAEGKDTPQEMAAREQAVAKIVAFAQSIRDDNDVTFKALGETKSDLASYAPPDAYAAPLKALRAKEQR